MLGSLLALLAYAIGCGLVNAATYNVFNNDATNQGSTAIAVTGVVAGHTWMDCEAECRANGQCRMFSFNINSGCSLYDCYFEYGSLSPPHTGYIVGQLEAGGARALLWVGLGYFEPYLIRANLPGGEPECKAECDGTEALFGFSCVAYTFFSGTYTMCMTYAGSVGNGRTQNPTQLSIRADVTLSDVTVEGDIWNTRLTPDQLPPAPPADPAPSFDTMDFHSSTGLQLWFAMETIAGVLTWEECSVECHRNVSCKSFKWVLDAGIYGCNLFDAYMVGLVEWGGGKYGIIDRNGAEGAVSYVGPAFKHQGDILSAQAIETRYNPAVTPTTLAGCAKMCYDCYSPITCSTFTFDSNNPKCTLYRVNPFVIETDFVVSQYSSDPTKYHVGYFADRLPTLPGVSSSPPISAAHLRRRQGDVQIFSIETGKSVQNNAPRETMIEKSSLRCTMNCHTRVWCKSFDWNTDSGKCALFDGNLTNNLGNNHTSAFGLSGGVFNSHSP